MKLLRIALEILGLAVYVAAHLPLAVFYALGSSLRDVRPVPYWTALALGYVAMAGVAFGWSRLRPRQPRRAFDAWLLSALPALVAATLFVQARWPLAYDGWNGHGFGAAGGEVNALLFPWMQAAVWLAALIGVKARQRGAHAH